MRIRNLQEFQARYPMSRAMLLAAMQGQERILNRSVAIFRAVRYQKNPTDAALDYTSDMVQIENNTMRAFLSYV